MPRQGAVGGVSQRLGLPAAKAWGPFKIVDVDNDVSLDFHEIDGDISSQHYSFLVTEQDFDDIFGRILANEIPFWADPAQAEAGVINRNDGGRGAYFNDPDGHLLEIITRPYGSG